MYGGLFYSCEMLPFLTDFYNPLQEDELEQSTEVQIIFPSEPKPVSE
jgi:hypothetical protein